MAAAGAVAGAVAGSLASVSAEEKRKWLQDIDKAARRGAAAANMRRLRQERRVAAGIPDRVLSSSTRAVKAREARKRAREG